MGNVPARPAARLSQFISPDLSRRDARRLQLEGSRELFQAELEAQVAAHHLTTAAQLAAGAIAMHEQLDGQLTSAMSGASPIAREGMMGCYEEFSDTARAVIRQVHGPWR